MIISHSRKFIFFKTKKTASSSLEVALGKYCSDEDIITPLPAHEEIYREEEHHYSARNYKLPMHKWKIRDFKRFMKGKNVGFYNHMAAHICRKYLTYDVWNKYYKFCFERNPFDRVISYIYFKYASKLHGAQGEDINRFVNDKILYAVKKGGYGIYTSNGRVIIDKIYRYEDMKNALTDIEIRLNLPEAITLPKLKSNFRKNRNPWHEILDQDNIYKIREFFSWELENLYPDILNQLEKVG